MWFARYRQLFLFMAMLALPVIGILIQGQRIAVQEQILSSTRRERNHQHAVAEIGQDYLTRLDAIALQQIRNAPTCNYSDPSVAMVGSMDEERRLVLQCDAGSITGALPPAAPNPEFLARLAEAEKAEFREKRYDVAASLYKELAAAAHDGSRRAGMQLAMARNLAQGGAVPAAVAAYRGLLDLPSSTTDEYGLSIASYAAFRLTELGRDGADVLKRIAQDLSSPSIPSAQLYRLRSVAAALGASEEAAIRERAVTAAAAIDSRIAVLEQAQRLQSGFSRLGLRDNEWRVFADASTWFVGKASPGAGRRPLVIAVRANAIRESVESGRLGSNGGPPFQIKASRSFASEWLLLQNGDYWFKDPYGTAEGGGDGELMNPRLPDLFITLDPVVDAEDGGGMRSSFYGLFLFSVLALSFVAAWLLWRDTRRERHIAELRMQFVSSVSHELKTPLTSIRMFADILRMQGSANPKMQDEYLETISNESERLTRLLNNVLDVSRIERGQKYYRFEPTRLVDVVDAVARAMQHPLSEQGFEMEFDIDEDIPPIQGDRDALQQAILNLLTNAMKYSGDRRDIALRLGRENDKALIQVTDHGIGIPPEEQRRIFEKFYRAPIPENLAISGTGLGLSLVIHIVEAHGGNVQVESRPGSGSTFLDPHSSAAGHHGDGRMSLVLVIEDDAAILRGLTDSLRFEGHDVIGSSDGDAGYRLGKEKKPDLVILDVMLPRMSGLDICRKLRGDGFKAPIIMLTARGEEADRVLGLDLGADDYVAKPFSILELLARVRAQLRRNESSEALPGEVRFDDVVVDFKRFEALRSGKAVELTRKEFGLLQLLAARAPVVVRREDLLNEVWGYENYPSTRTVDTHVASLRAKLEDDPASPRRIITVHGIGYKFFGA